MNIKKLIRRTSPFIILALFGLGAKWLISNKTPPIKTDPVVLLPTVDVITVNPQSIPLTIDSYGVVNAKHKTDIVSEVQGKIVALSKNFIAGGYVNKGDELARIEVADYQTDLIQAKASLAQALAQLEEEKARVEVAKKDWQHVSVSEAPKLGLRVPQLQKEQANVAYARAALERAERNVSRTVIKAPYSGLVIEKNIDMGQYLTIGSQVGRIYSTDIAEIRLPLTAKQINNFEQRFELNSEVRLTAERGGQQFKWQAKIVRSEGVVDETNRMTYLVAEIVDPYHKKSKKNNSVILKFGTFVNATILGPEIKNIVTLPRYLVRDGKVMVISEQQTAHFKPVNIVHQDIDNAYIQDSLQSGEMVSSIVLSTIAEGDKVQLKNSLENATENQSPVVIEASPTLLEQENKSNMEEGV
ncbi:efflux RND transporter periplasmic adaptor subunit [Vibrio sp. SS-MA-C1-2]|uniref:efflux RND transporter periplasmic adaptor subunit n=1 Tax=Vibrio sp. SS-MA-C1-2 TaxID=2908646 RepID=UPI001F3B56DD|nr:efflux RND transporter periplasmic adaptor subunit [Vibrio sp. SS-MA-C1-2]UJF19518.1 efflux RND transporter periplasmic adaptor subunit [Vibrio sp. SS-MA-C1-2]